MALQALITAIGKSSLNISVAVLYFDSDPPKDVEPFKDERVLIVAEEVFASFDEAALTNLVTQEGKRYVALYATKDTLASLVGTTINIPGDFKPSADTVTAEAVEG